MDIMDIMEIKWNYMDIMEIIYGYMEIVFGYNGYIEITEIYGCNGINGNMMEI